MGGMGKTKINMIGGGFQHDVCSSSGSVPKFMEWVKDSSADISIHIDNGIGIQCLPNKKSYAWISESSTINTGLLQWCRQNFKILEDRFIHVFTHDKSLLELSPVFKLVICNAKPWIKDIQIHNKTKLVSMIASSKAMCPDHLVRLKFIEKFKNSLDLYGRNINPINDKIDGLRDYMFSVTIENGTYDNMFTEKIADCFATGTVPIYWGSKSVNEFFNPKGIIWLNDDFDLTTLTPELYHSMKDSIEDNFKRINDFPIAEDYIYENYIK